MIFIKITGDINIDEDLDTTGIFEPTENGAIFEGNISWLVYIFIKHWYVHLKRDWTCFPKSQNMKNQFMYSICETYKFILFCLDASWLHIRLYICYSWLNEVPFYFDEGEFLLFSSFVIDNILESKLSISDWLHAHLVCLSVSIQLQLHTYSAVSVISHQPSP